MVHDATIPRRTSPGPAPLSYAQERIWFFNQLEPGSTLYNGVRASRWTGLLDLAALERSLTELVRRHEILRTRFPLTDTGGVQEIGAPGPIPLPVVDLSTLPEPRREEEAQRLLLAEARRPFALTREPPFRPKLLRLGTCDHLLILVVHQIASDRWSRSVLRRELAALYSAFAAGRPAQLAEPALQYQDYAEWQKRRVERELLTRELSYWRKRLGDAPRTLELPADHPRPAVASHRGRQVSLVLPEELVTGLEAIGRARRASLFMILLAGFKALLSRSTGRTDLVVGAPIAGRTRLELAGLIGCFTNTLVLRTELSGDPTFEELLGRVREVALEAYAHQELPFERLVGELAPDRSTGHHPLFQVLFNYLDFPGDPVEIEGVKIEDLEAGPVPALVDLGVDLKRAGNAFTCQLTGSADLFEPSTMDRLASQYRQVLETVAADPGRRLSGLPGAPAPLGQVAERLATLSPAKRALLELRLRRSRAEPAGTGLPPIVRQPRGDSVPLSFAQQRLWFLDQLTPGSPLYNVPCRAWLNGRLDVGALRRALDGIVARHESLRTRFPAVNGEPVQRIMPPAPCELTVTDLSSLPRTDREAAVRSAATEEARRPFDLVEGPLFRARLLRIGETEHALLITMHHIVSDGWSVGVLFRELGTLYEAFVEERPSPLPELGIQYADYALAQREWLQGAALDRELTYWKRQFQTVPAPLELPADRPRPSVPTHRGARVAFTLPAELTDRLGALATEAGCTPFMVFLAAFEVLLARYSGQDDIVVGTPIAGRTRPETEALIGFFINSLALRTDLSGDPTFRELLARVREVALGAYAHQELPFEMVVEAVRPQRDLTHAPLFQVMFVLQNTARSERRLHGLTLRHLEIDKGMAKFDLTLKLAEDAGRFRGVLSYDTDLFDSPRMERLVSHYRVLLEGIAAGPARRLSDLPLLPESERRQVLAEWNATARDYPRGRPLHELIEEQTLRRPEDPAVIADGVRLSFGALDQYAGRLARRLRSCGVGPEARVGLYAERSPELLVGLLAVLKAGGAYVPLDPAYPPERLGRMLRDAGARVLLAQPALLDRGLEPSLRDAVAEVVPLELLPDIPAAAGDGDRVAKVSPANLAYVMYTSGSTGAPKGVAVSHRSVVNFSRAAAEEYRMTAKDRVLHFASMASDISVDEIFPAWLSGAAVVLRAPGPPPGGEELAELLHRHCVSVVSLPTAYWHEWVQELQDSPQALPGSLRLVIVGGERAQPAALRRWCQLAPSRVRLLNTYGPTETTVEATLYDPGAAPPEAPDVPIGRPVANVQVYVLDRAMHPVPVGVPGELYIGGEGVARGYLGRPGLTAERFVPDPFGGEPGARLYRTGDRVRSLPDGNLVFGGRLDQQVKIRGLRVEPAEVEAILARHPGVREAVVTARDDAPGDPRLVGYVVPAQEPAPAAADLRRFLAQRLPDAMIPSAFVCLPALPLTPSGKVNSRALPAPNADRPELAEAFVAPRTSVEARIAEVWADVLRVGRVGVHDNFFDLGGHSLLATQVVARVRAALEVELPLRALFEAPTVAGLAERVEAVHRLLEEITSLSPGEVRARLSSRTEKSGALEDHQG